MTKQILSKLLILAVFIIVFSSSIIVGYSYFDELSFNQNETIYLGEWRDNGIAISTAQEFYDFATKLDSSADDLYYLTNDIDFSGFTWTYTNTLDDVIFKGTLNGNYHTIKNLTIYTNDTNHSYFGLFARSDGGTISNLTFDNVELDLGSTALNYSTMKTGLLFGMVYNGTTTTIKNVTLLNSGVRGTSVYGTGGLVGQVYDTNTVLNISNIKTSNFKVFTTSYNIGGLVGYIYSSGSNVNISNIDLDVEVYSNYSSSYAGGVVGKVRNGGLLSIDQAIVDMSTQNTLETSIGYQEFNGRYLGGIVGYNQSNEGIILSNILFTGSLIVSHTRYNNYIGTAIGRNSGLYTLNNVYYSQVEFLTSRGNISYSPDSPSGVMSILVSSDSLPSLSWWNDFALNFDSSVWNQDSTGRLYI